ncbi:Mak [Symbiodinium pilosum]|uniref:Mak protein n=1 Tax=Symbiodinium pilosum TaxID=2952 RepID=A0A812S921_SYMPI|nr:Mak [Symbiodinium pilosum]
MSFGVYRPQMGVASGMRVLCSDQSLQEQRRVAESNGRQQAPVVNPITGEIAGGVPEPKTTTRRPPSGCRKLHFLWERSCQQCNQHCQ